MLLSFVAQLFDIAGQSGLGPRTERGLEEVLKFNLDMLRNAVTQFHYLELGVIWTGVLFLHSNIRNKQLQQ